MNFADTLKKKADETGQKTIQGEIAGHKSATPVTKAGPVSKAGFAAALKAAPKADVTQGKTTQFKNPSVFDDSFEDGLVKKWSFSGLKGFEQCQWRTKLHKVDKIAQDSGDAANRGTMFHDGLEEWVRGMTDGIPSDAKSRMESFTEQLANLKVSFEQGQVTLEDKWGIRKDWSPCTWDDDEIWGRGALDGFVIQHHGLENGERIYFSEGGLLRFVDENSKDHDLSSYWLKNPEITKRIQLSCRIIDYKTGQKYGNEMKHADQGLCYGLHAMHRFPEIEVFQTEFWYLDQGVTTVRSFNRKQLGMLLLRYHNRARKMTETKNFIPSASVYNCQYCSYGSNVNKKGKPYGNGACGFDAYRGMGDDE